MKCVSDVYDIAISTTEEQAMRYPIVIEPSDGQHAYGVVIPDLPGCFSAGDTVDEAFASAREAAVGWIELELDDDHEIPSPSAMEVVAAKPEYRGRSFGFIDVPEELLGSKVERINITLPQRVLRRLDALAKDAGTSRSGYLACLVMERHAAVTAARRPL